MVDTPIPQLKMPATTVRPPRLRKPPALPTGPRLYRMVRTNQISYGGPGRMPAEFDAAAQSESEWIWYWASKRALDPDDDPRQPPYTGGRLWSYQSPELGEYKREKGSAIVDFLYQLSWPFLAVRIQTYRFHLAVDSLKQESDFQQLVALAGNFDVVDVFESDFISDETGETAVVMVKETLGLIRRQSPLTAGTVQLVRNALQR